MDVIGGHWVTKCPGVGQPVLEPYQPTVGGERPTAPIVREVMAQDTAAITEALRSAERERDDLRAQNMTLAHTCRMLVDAQRAMIESAILSHQSAIHSLNAQKSLLNMTENALPSYPNT